MPTTIPNKDDGSNAAWKARLPFILAFCLGEQVEFKSNDSEWLSCKYNRFGMRMKNDAGIINPPSYDYRILRDGSEIDPDIYLESVLSVAGRAPAQGGGGGVIQAIVRMFDFNL